MEAGRSRRSTSEIRALILESARRCFSERGYDHTTTREVAAGAGVSERLIYLHFTSKPMLFEKAVADPFVDYMSQFLEDWESKAAGDLDALALSWATGIYQLLEDNRTLVRALVVNARPGSSAAEAASPGLAAFGQMHALTERIMGGEAGRRGFGDLDVRLAVRLPFSTLLAVVVCDDVVFAGMDSRPDRDTLLRVLARQFVAGIERGMA